MEQLRKQCDIGDAFLTMSSNTDKTPPIVTPRSADVYPQAPMARSCTVRLSVLKMLRFEETGGQEPAEVRYLCCFDVPMEQDAAFLSNPFGIVRAWKVFERQMGVVERLISLSYGAEDSR